MRLLEQITIRIGKEEVELLPSLRHGLTIVRTYPSTRDLLRLLNEGSLSVTSDLIAPHYNAPMLDTRLRDAGIDSFKAPLFAYVAACMGIDDRPQQRSDAPKAKGKRQTAEENLIQLYRVGTGWLGWTPDTTLDATPAEITFAYEGVLDKLRAIYGGKDDKPKSDPNMSLDDKFRAAFSTFSTTKVAGTA
jgi:hypothetical protein